MEVTTRSGDVLKVCFERGPGGFSQLELEGPARVVYWGELDERPAETS